MKLIMNFLKKKLYTACILILVLFMVGVQVAQAQKDEDQKKSADEIARELSNPVGSLASMVFQGTWAFWDGTLEGASDQTSGAFVFLPTLPFKVWGGNLIVRPSFPVVGVPQLNSDGNWEKKYGFGDIVLIASWGKMEKSGIIWSIGATSVFPTAAEGLGKEQVQLGPAAIFGLLKDWGVIGGFWQHWWGLNPKEGQDAVNVGNIQLFYWFGIGNGWQVGGSPIPTANYATESDLEITFPINLGVAKTFIFGSLPLKATIQAQYFVTKPETFGQSWGIFFQITPVIKVPW
jgi:hypothetical protein